MFPKWCPFKVSGGQRQKWHRNEQSLFFEVSSAMITLFSIMLSTSILQLNSSNLRPRLKINIHHNAEELDQARLGARRASSRRCQLHAHAFPKDVAPIIAQRVAQHKET
jgi:hypothetical protein